MTLGVNGIRLVRDRSGVARAIEAILGRLGELPHPFERINVYTPVPLPSDVRLPPGAREVVVPSSLPPSLWEQVALPRAHGRRGVLLCPSYVLPVMAQCPTLLIHHGSYEGYKDAAQVFSWWRRVKYRISYPISAHRATVVCTVSEFSRRDMARYYRMPADRIHVVPEGVDTRVFRPMRDAAALSAWRARTLGADVPFVLYVGKPTKRRNLPNLLRAYARLRAEGLPHKLVLIGTRLPGTSFSTLIEELRLEDDVVSVPHLPHSEIVCAYNACSVFVYPSSYEGFGMPVLEAMACGTPVIALNNTALPEFAGGIARLLPDARVETLAVGMSDLLSDEGERQRMAEEGPRRAAAYDWTHVTRRYLELMQPLVERCA